MPPTQPPLTEVLTRQTPLALTLPHTVHVIGCGGVGSWLAMFLALARVPRLFLWDSDTVSESNLNRLPLGPDFLGINKATALKQMLHNLVNIEITALDRWTPELGASFVFPEHNPERDGLIWVTAGTDSWASRKLIYEFAVKQSIAYIELSAEGEFGGLTGEPATFATEDEVNPGYASVPVHVGPCVASAAMAAYHILHGTTPGAASHRFGWNRQTNTIEYQHS